MQPSLHLFPVDWDLPEGPFVRFDSNLDSNPARTSSLSLGHQERPQLFGRGALQLGDNVAVGAQGQADGAVPQDLHGHPRGLAQRK